MRQEDRSPPPDRRGHWDEMYERSGQRSWYQDVPTPSLEMIEVLAPTPHTPVLDVGGGASRFVDELLDRGFTDVSVLDVSEAAIDSVRQRLGGREGFHWIVEDLLSWEPNRTYGLWHDRAVFHFFVDPVEQARYREVLRRSVRSGGAVVIATFAPDGPTTCSGLPVKRWSSDEIAGFLGEDFDVVETRRQDHVTPADRVQPFTWLAATRTDA
jgi:SAM-dependent methyltransferase